MTDDSNDNRDKVIADGFASLVELVAIIRHVGGHLWPEQQQQLRRAEDVIARARVTPAQPTAADGVAPAWVADADRCPTCAAPRGNDGMRWHDWACPVASGSDYVEAYDVSRSATSAGARCRLCHAPRDMQGRIWHTAGCRADPRRAL